MSRTSKAVAVGTRDAAVLARQVVAEELLEAEPPEEAVEDRQRGDAAGGQGPAGGAGGLAGRCGEVGGRPGGSAYASRGRPSTCLAAIGSGGRSAATSAVMVVGSGGPSRGKNPYKNVISICLDVSRAARDLRLGAPAVSHGGGEGDRRGGHCPGVGQGEECRTRRRGPDGEGARLDVPLSPRRRRLTPNFDQLRGNSEIMPTRCAERRIVRVPPGVHHPRPK